MSAVELSKAFTSNYVQVVAESDDGGKVTQTLTDGESILVGSDDQCRMRLPDKSVSSKHCLVRFQHNEVTLQDWCSEGGTHLNGEPIDGIAILSPVDRVQLGVYRLTFAASGSAEPLKTESLESRPPAKVVKDASPVSTTAGAKTSNPGAENTLGDALAYARSSEPETEDTPEDEVSYAGSSHPETEEAPEDKLVDAGSLNPAEEPPSLPATPVQSVVAEMRTMESPAAATIPPRKPRDNPSVEQSTLDLLKSEIEMLQAELSEKDAQLSQLSTANKGSVDHDPQASHPELESRIERLLFELDQSDQRVAALEEVSRLAEETQIAEAEEKRQLEAWVDDIEKRIADREAESQAECDVLRQRLEKAADERSHLNEQVDQLARSEGGGDPALEEMVQTLRREVQGLRQENESLCEKVAERDAAYEQQKKRCEEFEQQTTGGGDEYIQQRIDEALRAERLLLAQERATLSRQQLELTNKVHELTHEVERQNRVHPVDDKFRVFREQLKELHEQEKTDQGAPTVSQRLARLWQRLDGPTDRD